MACIQASNPSFWGWQSSWWAVVVVKSGDGQSTGVLISLSTTNITSTEALVLLSTSDMTLSRGVEAMKISKQQGRSEREMGESQAEK